MQYDWAPSASDSGSIKWTHIMSALTMNTNSCRFLMWGHNGCPHIRWCVSSCIVYSLNVASTYDISRALDYRKQVVAFVGCIHELRVLELDEDEWEVIKRVTDWLKTFRSAMSQMLGTKGMSTLSTTHTVFRGLQEHVADIIHFLPASSNPQIKDGLLNTHRKLSDYYYKYDQSSFYTWSAHKSSAYPMMGCGMTTLII